MASVSIRCEGACNSFRGRSPGNRNNVTSNTKGGSFVAISRGFNVSRGRIRCSASGMAITEAAKPKTKNKIDVNEKKIERWMENSVVEIVKNLKEAPLLVHVYDNDETTTEKSVGEDNWGVVMEKWVKKESPLPQGLIFVEQLDKETDGDKEEDGITRAWGVVVQGRGVECGPVCYLLKTSRAVATGGGGGGGDRGGVCCTHFCLMRVQSFRESSFSQFKKSWLILP